MEQTVESQMNLLLAPFHASLISSPSDDFGSSGYKFTIVINEEAMSAWSISTLKITVDYDIDMSTCAARTVIEVSMQY